MLPRGVSVTLVQPKGPVNVGHLARLVSNFGAEKLYLVEPAVDISVAAIYASHASEVLDNAVITTFEKVREENELLVATTAVKAAKKSNVIRRSVRPERLHDILSSAKTSSLVFGRDTTGLTNREIRMCDVTTTIDTAPGYKALNIGHAAAIILYMASRRGDGHHRKQGRHAREVFAKSFFELAKASRVPPHKVRNLFEVGKRVAATSSMTDAQLHLLTGVFRKAVATMDTVQERGS
ncbi:MAG TPA: TrmH family RNA methyltransferase, partial [Nitrososphaerales archaeon]|nr:TrmH family RNA methyltransferase [Nitrososphaerales archaeon]